MQYAVMSLNLGQSLFRQKSPGQILSIYISMFWVDEISPKVRWDLPMYLYSRTKSSYI